MLWEVKYRSNGKTYAESIEAISSGDALSKAKDNKLNEPEVLGRVLKHIPTKSDGYTPDRENQTNYYKQYYN